MSLQSSPVPEVKTYTKPIYVRIRPNVRDLFDKEIRKSGKSGAAIIEEALQMYLNGKSA